MFGTHSEYHVNFGCMFAESKDFIETHLNGVLG